MADKTGINYARYKADLANSLYSVILEQAAGKCSEDLFNLISIACDLNQEVVRLLQGDSEVVHG